MVLRYALTLTQTGGLCALQLRMTLMGAADAHESRSLAARQCSAKELQQDDVKSESSSIFYSSDCVVARREVCNLR